MTNLYNKVPSISWSHLLQIIFVPGIRYNIFDIFQNDWFLFWLLFWRKGSSIANCLITNYVFQLLSQICRNWLITKVIQLRIFNCELRSMWITVRQIYVSTAYGSPPPLTAYCSPLTAYRSSVSSTWLTLTIGFCPYALLCLHRDRCPFSVVSVSVSVPYAYFARGIRTGASVWAVSRYPFYTSFPDRARHLRIKFQAATAASGSFFKIDPTCHQVGTISFFGFRQTSPPDTRTLRSDTWLSKSLSRASSVFIEFCWRGEVSRSSSAIHSSLFRKPLHWVCCSFDPQL